MKIGRTTVMVLAVLLLLGTAASALPAKKAAGEANEIIDGLKAGIHALSKMGRHEEAAHLERVLKEYVAKLEAQRERERAKAAKAAPKSEREVVEHRLEILRLAMKGLMEKDAIDAASLVEHRIHMYELALAGRRDEEAKKVRETCPSPEQMVAPLKKAGVIWKGFGKEEKARLCWGLAEQYQEQAQKRAARKKQGATEQEVLKRHMEILRVARHGLLEAEKKDAAHRIEQVLHVYELAIEGQREKAMKAREKAPNSGQLTELLFYASRIWAEFGHETKAGQCKELGQYYRQRWQQQKEREQRAADERKRAADQKSNAAVGQNRRLEKELKDAQRMIEELEKRIRRLEEGK